MKKITNNASPFLLLVIPFFVAIFIVGGQVGSEIIQERIQLNASFIKLPDLDILKAFVW